MNQQRALPIYDQAPPARKVWKRQRQTAREVYRRQRAIDLEKQQAGKETREAQVLRCLAAWWNCYQTSPTALELLAWMQERGEHVFDCNSIRPRITKLVELGLVEARSKRRSVVSGETVRTWSVREAGSERGP